MSVVDKVYEALKVEEDFGSIMELVKHYSDTLGITNIWDVDSYSKVDKLISTLLGLQGKPEKLDPVLRALESFKFFMMNDIKYLNIEFLEADNAISIEELGEIKDEVLIANEGRDFKVDLSFPITKESKQLGFNGTVSLEEIGGTVKGTILSESKTDYYLDTSNLEFLGKTRLFKGIDKVKHKLPDRVWVTGRVDSMETDPSQIWFRKEGRDVQMEVKEKIEIGDKFTLYYSEGEESYVIQPNSCM